MELEERPIPLIERVKNVRMLWWTTVQCDKKEKEEEKRKKNGRMYMKKDTRKSMNHKKI